MAARRHQVSRLMHGRSSARARDGSSEKKHFYELVSFKKPVTLPLQKPSVTLSCIVLPAELVSRELDAAKSTVARFEHLDHLSIMCFKQSFNTGDHLHGYMWMEKAQHAFPEARGISGL